jgi:hypothetical protein
MTQSLYEVQPGSNYAKTIELVVDATVDLTGSVAEWQLRDDQNNVLSTGQATYTLAAASGGEVVATLTGTVAIPADLEANPQGQGYRLLWILTPVVGSSIRSQETVVVDSVTYQLTGPQAAVLVSGSVRIQLITGQSYSTVTVQIYAGNTVVPGYETPIAAAADGATASGYVYGLDVAALTLPDQGLDAYTVMWTYSNVGQVSQQAVGSLYYVNPSILMAMKDVQTTIQRAVLSTTNTPDTVFEPHVILDFLRLGRDTFNAMYQPTMFTMSNATGPVRSFWLAYSNIQALRSQYLVEGLRNFDFSGSQINLTVEHSQYFEQAASQIEQSVQEPMRQFKTILSKRGATAGDGNVNPLGLRAGAVGAVGIALSPVGARWQGNNQTWGGLFRG